MSDRFTFTYHIHNRAGESQSSHSQSRESPGWRTVERGSERLRWAAVAAGGANERLEAGCLAGERCCHGLLGRARAGAAGR